MKTNAPKFITWVICLIVGVLGILGHLNIIKVAFLMVNGFWMLVVAFGLLILATILKGL